MQIIIYNLFTNNSQFDERKDSMLDEKIDPLSSDLTNSKYDEISIIRNDNLKDHESNFSRRPKRLHKSSHNKSPHDKLHNKIQNKLHVMKLSSSYN